MDLIALFLVAEMFFFKAPLQLGRFALDLFSDLEPVPARGNPLQPFLIDGKGMKVGPTDLEAGPA